MIGPIAALRMAAVARCCSVAGSTVSECARQLAAEVIRLVLSVAHVELLPGRRVLEQRQAPVGCGHGKVRRGVELRGAA